MSSAVLSSTDGVSHNEETAIDSKEVQALRAKKDHKPLFEQLRSNKEDEEATREEFQRSIMRGTRALDEEDCAHLDAVQREKQKRDQAVKASLDEELALFRAARADRAQTDLVIDDDQGSEDEDKDKKDDSDKKMSSESKKTPVLPIILKRRRRQPPGSESSAKKTKTTKTKVEAKESPADQEKKTEAVSAAGGLTGLLGDYGSSDDDSD